MREHADDPRPRSLLPVQSVQGAMQRTPLAAPSTMPPSMPSPALLASLLAHSKVSFARGTRLIHEISQ